MTARRRALLVATTFGLLGAAYFGGQGLGLHQTVPERHRLYGIPVAVSMDVYGLDGYVAYSAIARRFFNDKPIDTVLSVDLPRTPDGRRDAEALRDDPNLFFIPADDKGYVTFTRLAFALFGLSLDSLYTTYFLLLLGSVAAFCAVFQRDTLMLFVAVCTQLALVSMLSAFQDGLLRPHVVTFYDVRIFGVIAVLATIHVAAVCAAGERVTVWQAVALLFQIAVILLAIHVRSENLLLVFALAGAAAGGLGRQVVRRLRGAAFSPLWACAWPLAALAAAGSVLLAWERFAYHPNYFQQNMSHHLIWHNAGLGLALHPRLGAAFDYQISDYSMVRRVARHLHETGQHQVLTEVFGASYSSASGTPQGVHVDVGMFLNGPNSDLRRYNGIARQVTLGALRQDPGAAAALFLHYKPRFILHHFLWFTAFLTYDQPTLQADGRQSPLLRAEGDTRQREIYYSPLPASALVVFVLAVYLAWPIAAAGLLRALLLALSLFAFSLLPGMVAYPAPHLMGTALVALAVVLYLALGLVIVVTANTLTALSAKRSAVLLSDLRRSTR